MSKATSAASCARPGCGHEEMHHGEHIQEDAKGLRLDPEGPRGHCFRMNTLPSGPTVRCRCRAFVPPPAPPPG